MKTTIEDKLIDQLLANYRKPEDLTGPEGLCAEVEMHPINPTLQASYRRGVR